MKDRDREVKRYGVRFACLASRGVHLEIANTMDASSFLNACQRFVGRRGPVRHLRSDRGTNLRYLRIAARRQCVLEKMEERIPRNASSVSEMAVTQDKA